MKIEILRMIRYKRGGKLIKILIGIMSFLFIMIGILHVFWAFGGSWGVNAALPTKDDSKLPVLRPRMLGTLFIGFLCFFASVLLFVQIELDRGWEGNYDYK
jgi:hypothetical protein